MAIPLFNLARQHAHMMDEIMERIRPLFEQGDFTLGQAVKEFEKAFAQYLGVRQAVAVGSGADALLLALRALDVMPGDDVLVPAYGPIETVEAVARLYANPVFVDIDPNSYGMDQTKLQQAMTDKCRAIIAGHVYGYPCTIDQICQFAKANGLTVIEDVSQALGSTYMNKKLGTHGMLGCYSFSPTMNLGAAGDAGMIATDNDDMATRLRRLRNHGLSEDMTCDESGIGSLMDNIQAALLRMKLDDLDESNADRIENARLYDRLLHDTPVKRPRFSEDGSAVYSYYTIEHEQRDALQAYLAQKGIASKAYYPLPHHLQPCFEYLEYAHGSFHVAETVSARVLSLPVYPGLTKREIEEVAAAVKEFFSASA